MPPEPRLAIVATVQQAITSLLTTYEPEFLRFGYSLFVGVRHHSAGLAGHPDDDGPRRGSATTVRLRQAAALHLVRLRADRLLRVADSRASASRSAT